ncbi:helicase associated domain-containing protein [Streptomyces cynarae]|uniref:helicase associated domain-containing protein n=1 Tax=Streptomyces cynarae TaxID=2981134 RepID=UPI0028BD8837|nr:helicase associated domain-containing protein [Streptomyces cynarae]
MWSHFDVAWEEGLAAARGWAAENGHLLAPLDATYQGYRVGIWLKNARAAARKAAEIEQRRAEGLPVESVAGALSEERREQLEEIDPSWCPAWPVGGSAPSIWSGCTWRPAASCPCRRVGSCTRARIWAGGCARSGWAGTSSQPCSSGCVSTSSASSPPPRTRNHSRAVRRPTNGR